MEHKIFDINSFLNRNKWTHKELAEKIGCKTGLVSVWASTDQTPSFSKILKLFDLGMTFEEVFGTDISSKTKIFLNEKKVEVENEDDFERKVCEILVKRLGV